MRRGLRPGRADIAAFFQRARARKRIESGGLGPMLDAWQAKVNWEACRENLGMCPPGQSFRALPAPLPGLPQAGAWLMAGRAGGGSSAPVAGGRPSVQWIKERKIGQRYRRVRQQGRLSGQPPPQRKCRSAARNSGSNAANAWNCRTGLSTGPGSARRSFAALKETLCPFPEKERPLQAGSAYSQPVGTKLVPRCPSRKNEMPIGNDVSPIRLQALV